MKKLLLFLALLISVNLTACTSRLSSENEKINIVCTVFPQYDFVREIAEDYVNLTMLLPPGSEAHSFEPTPKDIITIQDSDLFIMIGGESEEWADKIVNSNDELNTEVIRLIDSVDTVEEETKEGMDAEDTHHESIDEHIWTSPENAIIMVNEICDALCRVDDANSEVYRQNAENYISELERLNIEFKNTVNNGKRNTLIFADRFPFRYLTDSIGLDYYAAFPGCSSKTEPSASTIAFLIDKINTEGIPYVFCVDYGDTRIADSIKKETGTEILRMYSCHIITKDEFESGEGYVSLMKKNISALKEALN